MWVCPLRLSKSFRNQNRKYWEKKTQQVMHTHFNNSVTFDFAPHPSSHCSWKMCKYDLIINFESGYEFEMHI